MLLLMVAQAVQFNQVVACAMKKLSQQLMNMVLQWSLLARVTSVTKQQKKD